MIGRPGSDTIVCLGKEVPWYGSRTGYYARLPEAIGRLGMRVKRAVPRRGALARLIGKLIATHRRLPGRNQANTLAEFEFDILRKWHRPAVSLILSIEDHLPYAEFHGRRAGKVPREIVPVIHHPYDLWEPDGLETLSLFQSAVILYSSDIPRFESHLGPGRLRMVPHGVDVDFFVPPQEGRRSANRVLFVGQFGRDYRMLVDVINHLSNWRPQLEFHVLTGPWGYAHPAWRDLNPGARLVRHSKIDDDALRDLYQTSALMVQPLEYCAANNAVVEGMACGIPIVATDVGGIRDYGGGRIFPLAPRGDVAAFSACAISLLTSPDQLAEIGSKERHYAEEHLSWECSARAHLKAVHALSGASLS